MSIIHQVGNMQNNELRWQGVPVRAYDPENSGADRSTRQVLIGPDENSPHFHMRYFAVQPMALPAIPHSSPLEAGSDANRL